MTTLNEILELAPNHVSASALKKRYTGKVPSKYSLKESVNKIMTVASPFVSIMLDEENQSIRLTQRGGFTIPEFQDRVISDTQRKLNKLSLKLDQGSVELHSSVIDLISAWGDFQKRGHRSSSSREGFIDAREGFHQALDDLRLDEETYKELIR